MLKWITYYHHWPVQRVPSCYIKVFRKYRRILYAAYHMQHITLAKLTKIQLTFHKNFFVLKFGASDNVNRKKLLSRSGSMIIEIWLMQAISKQMWIFIYHLKWFFSTKFFAVLKSKLYNAKLYHQLFWHLW